MSFRSAWATYQGSGQPVLHSQTPSQKTKTKQKRKKERMDFGGNKEQKIGKVRVSQG
jgi:hypothetical protein